MRRCGGGDHDAADIKELAVNMPSLSDRAILYEKVTCSELRLEPCGSGCVVVSFEMPVEVLGCFVPESEAASVLITSFRVGSQDLLNAPFEETKPVSDVDVMLPAGQFLRIDFTNAKRRAIRLRPAVLIRRVYTGVWN